MSRPTERTDRPNGQLRPRGRRRYRRTVIAEEHADRPRELPAEGLQIRVRFRPQPMPVEQPAPPVPWLAIVLVLAAAVVAALWLGSVAA